MKRGMAIEDKYGSDSKEARAAQAVPTFYGKKQKKKVVRYRLTEDGKEEMDALPDQSSPQARLMSCIHVSSIHSDESTLAVVKKAMQSMIDQCAQYTVSADRTPSETLQKLAKENQWILDNFTVLVNYLLNRELVWIDTDE